MIQKRDTKWMSIAISNNHCNPIILSGIFLDKDRKNFHKIILMITYRFIACKFPHSANLNRIAIAGAGSSTRERMRHAFIDGSPRR